MANQSMQAARPTRSGRRIYHLNYRAHRRARYGDGTARIQLSLSPEAVAALKRARNASAFAELGLLLAAAMLSGEAPDVQRAAALWALLEADAPLEAHARALMLLLRQP